MAFFKYDCDDVDMIVVKLPLLLTVTPALQNVLYTVEVLCMQRIASTRY